MLLPDTATSELLESLTIERTPAKLSEVMTPKAKKIAVINLIMVKFPNYCVCSEFSTAEVSFW